MSCVPTFEVSSYLQNRGYLDKEQCMRLFEELNKYR